MLKKLRKVLSGLFSWSKRHKIGASFIILIIVVGGYFTYKYAFAGPTVNQYVLAPAHIGTLTQTVTGSGQISAENQLDIKSEVSGTIISITRSVGDVVHTGDLIATIDSHDAVVDLENARIALAKLTEPAKQGDVSDASNNLSKTYTDGFNAVSEAFLHEPTIMDGLKDLIYGSSGYLSTVISSSLSGTSKTYMLNSSKSYDIAVDEYALALNEYRSLNRSSATSSIENLINDTLTLNKKISGALKDAQAAVTFISVNESNYYPSLGATAATNIGTWSGTVNGDISSLSSVMNSIKSSNNTFSKLIQGADSLDIQSQKLALAQKQYTYGKYFIRAPFDGVVGRIPVNIHDTASNGTVIATVVGLQKVTAIPLNEVDAVKVAKGQKATLTFDAINGLKLNGTVTEVDLVGTASQGVITYNVKITLNEDDRRIRTGMGTDAIITTEEKENVLLVPATAVKTQGQRKYVEMIDETNNQNGTNINIQTSGQNRTSNSAFENSTNSTTTSRILGDLANGTSTLNSTSTSNRNRVLTITSSTPPRQQIVTVGDSDDTNTEILSGLTDGERIVVRTIAGSPATAQSSTPTLFSGLGGAQRNVVRGANGGTGAVRVTGGAAGR